MSPYPKYITIDGILSNTRKEGDCNIWLGPYCGNVPYNSSTTQESSIRRRICKILDWDCEDKFAMTSCGNKGCVNPDHILIAPKGTKINSKPQPAYVDTIVKLYESGMSQEEVGWEVGLSQAAVSRWLRIRGYKPHPKEATNKSDIYDNPAPVEKLLRHGKTYSEIGEILGYDRTTIYRCVKRHGLTPNKKGHQW